VGPYEVGFESRLGGGKMRCRLNKDIDPILEEEFKPKRLA